MQVMLFQIRVLSNIEDKEWWSGLAEATMLHQRHVG